MPLDIKAAFERHNDEYLEFERIEHPANRRPDICAFLLLDALVPGTDDIVSASAHDEFFLSTDIEALANVATDADILPEDDKSIKALYYAAQSPSPPVAPEPSKPICPNCGRTESQHDGTAKNECLVFWPANEPVESWYCRNEQAKRSVAPTTEEGR